MTQLAAPLVGRATELGVLERALAELEQGRPCALEFLGEPGIGKSRLLAELAARADEHAYIVLSGRASELERDLPFWVFVDALDEYVHALEPGRLDSLDDQARAELAGMLPSLVTLRGGSESALQDERYRAHRAVRELLGAVAAAKPLVLILDDVHWADSGSIELLGALLRSPPAAPVLIAVAARPRQLPERLAAALERAHRSDALVRAELDPLTRDEAAELLGESVTATVATDLHRESGGNPFYLEQLARVPQRGAAAGGARKPRSGDVPAGVAAALTEELALLPESARRALEGAAIAGDPFTPELAAAAAGVSESEVIDALDELLRLALVRITDVPRRFRFRHPLVRRAVYEATPGGRRLAAHERAAEALAAAGAPAAARAHHVEQAARQGDLAAVEVLCEAGESVVQRTPAGAARWFAVALSLLPASAPSEQRVALLTALAGAQAATGRFEEARLSLLECIELLPVSADELRVKLIASCAGIEQLLGRHEAAHARLESGLAGLADASSSQGVALTISLALSSYYRRQYDDALDWSVRGLDVANRLGDPPLVAAASAAAALAAACARQIDDAERYAAAAVALVEAMPDEELAIRLDALAYLTVADVYLDRYGEAISHAERGLAVARATGQGELLPMLMPGLGHALTTQGRLREAAELLDGAAEGARLADNRQALAWHLLNRAFNATRAGELETALAVGEEAWELARGLDDSVIATYAGVVLGFVHMERGDVALAAELFVTVAGGADLPLFPGGDRALYLELLTGCLLALGDRAGAVRAVAAAAEVAATTPRRLVHAWAERAAAAVALAEGDSRTAAELALSAAAAADEVGVPIEAAVSRTLAGRALAQAGDRERAAAELERAAAVLDACGALRHRDAAERELRKLGRRRARTPRGRADGDGLASLTERELQVARLAVERKTNPEIAAELFLSQKTVETHMRNIFHKLGVTSRVDVARLVERADREAAGQA
jgi:ATP/maltotriose-dependent transcriptional regulator MalT